MNFFDDAHRNNYNFNKDIYQNSNTTQKRYVTCPFCPCTGSGCKLNCCGCSGCPSCSNIKEFSKSRPYCFALIVSGISLFIILLILIIALSVQNNKKDKTEKETEKEKEKETQTETGGLDYIEIYNNIGDNDKGTLEEFCSYLSSKASNLDEEQKVKLAYKWITENIVYDTEGVKAKTEERDPDKFFQSRKTVCTGYAHLLYRLLISMNYDENKILNVTGMGKGEGYNVYEEPKVNHEWNAVKINEKWCLLDATWDFNKTDYAYFCTKPECFGRDHWPENSEYQFLDNPINKETFHNYVFTTGAFCELNAEIIEDKSIYNSCKGSFTVKYDVDYKTELYIQEKEEKKFNYTINNIDKGFKVEYLFEPKGKYELLLFMLNENMNIPNIATIYFNCE